MFEARHVRHKEGLLYQKYSLDIFSIFLYILSLIFFQATGISYFQYTRKFDLRSQKFVMNFYFEISRAD